MPFILSSLVRLFTYFGLSWDTFDASELALSTGIILFFAGLSLLQADLVIADEERESDRSFAAWSCFIFAVALIVVFALIEAFDILLNDRQVQQVETPLRTLQVLTWSLFGAAMWMVIQLQKSFKLTARLA